MGCKAKGHSNSCRPACTSMGPAAHNLCMNLSTTGGAVATHNSISTLLFVLSVHHTTPPSPSCLQAWRPPLLLPCWLTPTVPWSPSRPCLARRCRCSWGSPVRPSTAPAACLGRPGSTWPCMQQPGEWWWWWWLLSGSKCTQLRQCQNGSKLLLSGVCGLWQLLRASKHQHMRFGTCGGDTKETPAPAPAAAASAAPAAAVAAGSGVGHQVWS